MKWTKDVPSAPGWYWRRTKYGDAVVWLDHHESEYGDSWFGFEMTPEGPYEIGAYSRLFNCEWSGPIPSPGSTGPALSDAIVDEIEEAAKLAKHAEESELPYPYHPGFVRVRPDSVLMLVDEIRRQRKGAP